MNNLVNTNINNIISPPYSDKSQEAEKLRLIFYYTENHLTPKNKNEILTTMNKIYIYLKKLKLKFTDHSGNVTITNSSEKDKYFTEYARFMMDKMMINNSNNDKFNILKLRLERNPRIVKIVSFNKAEFKFRIRNYIIFLFYHSKTPSGPPKMSNPADRIEYLLSTFKKLDEEVNRRSEELHKMQGGNKVKSLKDKHKNELNKLKLKHNNELIKLKNKQKKELKSKNKKSTNKCCNCKKNFSSKTRLTNHKKKCN